MQVGRPDAKAESGTRPVLLLSSHSPRDTALCCRTETRERRREAKAETAAKLESAIETELLKRLQSGMYGDIYNFPVKQYEAALQQAAEQEADDRQGKMEYVEAESDEDDASQVCSPFFDAAWTAVSTGSRLCKLLPEDKQGETEYVEAESYEVEARCALSGTWVSSTSSCITGGEAGCRR